MSSAHTSRSWLAEPHFSGGSFAQSLDLQSTRFCVPLRTASPTPPPDPPQPPSRFTRFSTPLFHFARSLLSAATNFLLSFVCGRFTGILAIAFTHCLLFIIFIQLHILGSNARCNTHLVNFIYILVIAGVVCGARYLHAQYAVHKAYVADVKLKVAGLRRDIREVIMRVREIMGEDDHALMERDFEKYCRWVRLRSRAHRAESGLCWVNLKATTDAMIWCYAYRWERERWERKLEVRREEVEACRGLFEELREREGMIQNEMSREMYGCGFRVEVIEDLDWENYKRDV